MRFEDWAVVAPIASAVATVALALLTLMYVIATRAMASEMKKSREATEEPYVLAYATVSASYVFMTVENVGGGPAYDIAVHTSMEVPWRRARPNVDGRLYGIGFLPAKVSRQRLIEVLTLGMKADAYPPATVTTHWRDATGKSFTSESLVEVAPLIEFHEEDRP